MKIKWDNNILLNKRQRFATRKLKVGLVSVLLGFFMAFSSVPYILNNNYKDIVSAKEVSDNGNTMWNQYESKGILYDTGDFYGSLSQGYSENVAKVKASVDVQKIGDIKVTTDSSGKKIARQQWIITYNKYGLDNVIKNLYTSKPRLAFALSSDLKIDGNINFSLTDTSDGRISSIQRSVPNIPPYWNYPIMNIWLGDGKLDYLNIFTGSKAHNGLYESGWPHLELFRYITGDDMNGIDNSAKIVAQNVINDSDTLYVFQLDNRTRKNGAQHVQVSFTTILSDYQAYGQKNQFVINNTENAMQINNYKPLISRVSGIYFSWDDFHCFSRIDTFSREMNFKKDSDQDGLTDYYEKFIGTNLNNKDTDGDLITDGNEIKDKTPNPPNVIDGIFRIEGTSPLVPKPTAPIKLIGKKGEMVQGKTKPLKTVYLGMYENNSSKSQYPYIGSTISDSQGNYQLIIGKELQTYSVMNQFGNNIKLGGGNTEQAMIMNSPYKSVGTTTEYLYNSENKEYGHAQNISSKLVFKTNSYSNGFEGSFIYADSEQSKIIEMVNSFEEKYGKVIPKKTVVINSKNLSRDEKNLVGKRVMDAIYSMPNNPSYVNLVNDLYNGKNSVIVEDDGTAKIHLKGESMYYDLAPVLTIEPVEKPIFAKVKDISATLGTNINSLEISNIDKRATSILLKSAVDSSAILTINNVKGIWSINNNNFILEENNGKLYIIPSNNEVSILEDLSIKANSQNQKGLMISEIINKDANPKNIDSDYIEYTVIKPVTKAPEISTVNEKNPNIIINNISSETNKITIYGSKNGNTKILGILTRDAGNNGSWILNSNSNINYLNSKGIKFTNNSVTISPNGNLLEKLQGENIKVVATNTNYTGKANNEAISNTVNYDTEVEKPEIQGKLVYGEQSVSVNLPKDAEVGDKVSLNINGNIQNIMVDKEKLSQNKVVFNLQKPLSGGDKVIVSITDSVGNTASTNPIIVPKEENSAAITDFKQIGSNEVEATVQNFTGDAIAYLEDDNGNKLLSIKVEIGNELSNGTRELTANIPNGLNGKKLKMIFVQNNHKESESNVITINQGNIPVSNTNPIIKKIVDPVKENTANTTQVLRTSKNNIASIIPVSKQSKENIANTTPVSKPSKENIANTTPVSKPSKENIANTTPVSKPSKENTVNTTPVSKPSKENIANTTPVSKPSENDNSNTNFVNKKQLEITVKYAKKIMTTNKFNNASISNKEEFNKVLQKAINILNNGNVTQDEVNQTIKSLQSVINNLNIGENNITIYIEIKAYILGYPDGMFKPDRHITRAEAAAMIARIQELGTDNKSKPEFKDIKSSWYNAAINSVVNSGYMKGYPDGTFKPDKAITRAEFAEIISNIISTKNGLAPFIDIKDNWAYKAINKVYANRIINGYPDGTFKPDKAITRVETTSMLNKLNKLKVTEEDLIEIPGQIEMINFKDNIKGEWYYNDILEAANNHKYYKIIKN